MHRLAAGCDEGATARELPQVWRLNSKSNRHSASRTCGDGPSCGAYPGMTTVSTVARASKPQGACTAKPVVDSTGPADSAATPQE